MNFLPIILSGGSGTRLWPLSTSRLPKQYIDLLGQSLHTMTLQRLKKYGSPLVVTSKNYEGLTKSELRSNSMSARKILLEPEAKNTAAAIALCCRFFEFENETDQVAGVFAADHLVSEVDEFHKTLQIATQAAIQNQLVVLGIKPTRPETGFGYIQVGDRLIGSGKTTSVIQFHEKPDFERAVKYLASGDVMWNAGIFVFKISHMINLFKEHQAELWSHMSALKSDFSNIAEVFSHLKSISIDYAIIEKMNKSQLKCVNCDIGWDDLGSWDSVMSARENMQSYNENQLKPLEELSTGVQYYQIPKKIYASIGVENLMIIDSKDALLVCRRGDSQKVKEIVEKVNAAMVGPRQDRNREIRPWGEFEVLADQKHFKSKIIRVDPGQKLSYQSHEKRAEHWIVVKGSASVILNDEEKHVENGQHIFIPQGAKHRIFNQTDSILELVEIQIGSYFGEDDITRYQDDYGRKN